MQTEESLNKVMENNISLEIEGRIFVPSLVTIIFELSGELWASSGYRKRMVSSKTVYEQ